MSFDSVPSKQTLDVILSHKITKPNHLVLIFNNIQATQTPFQKCVGMFLNDKLNFRIHLIKWKS